MAGFFSPCHTRLESERAGTEPTIVPDKARRSRAENVFHWKDEEPEFIGSSREPKGADVSWLTDYIGALGEHAPCENSFGILSLLADFGEREDWQKKGLCAQTDPEAFFPEKGGSTREAKKICSGCEVKAECLEYALSSQEPYGVWGGLSERERRRLRRREA